MVYILRLLCHHQRTTLVIPAAENWFQRWQSSTENHHASLAIGIGYRNTVTGAA